MSTTTARPQQRLAHLAGVTKDHPKATIGAGVLLLVLASAYLRTRAIDAAFWIDEGISVGISSYPFFDVPSVMKVDGSPPLYYLLLNVWMDLFGTGESATHALSLVFSLLAIPVALWAGRSLWGPKTGWFAAALAALNPYWTYYAQETRMYSLQAVLSVIVTAAFIHAFVRRDRRYVPVFAIALATMLYTHNWALFLGAGTALTLAVIVRMTPERDERIRIVKDAALAYAGIAVLFVVWVPTLLYQVKHTGAPWATRPNIDDLASAVALVLGGTTVAIALLLVAGSGLVTQIRERADRKTLALVVLTFGSIVIAFVLNQASPAFANRYFASFVGPLVLCAAVGLSHAGRLGIAALILTLAFWWTPRTGELNSKNNTRSVAASIAPLITTGDLVVATHPESMALLSYYFPKGVKYANLLGPVDDPRVLDWSDITERLEAKRPKATINGLLATMRPGQEIVLAQPILRTGRWRAPWTSLVRRRVIQWERFLDKDPRVRREAVVPVFGYDRLPRGIRCVVYRIK
jgi:mannosyltransferase